MNNKKNNSNLKQILILVFFIIIIGIIGYISSNIDYTNDVSSSNIISADLENIPDYSGNPYIEINNNIPFFNESDYTTTAFEQYSELDNLGRCGVAYANICKEIMPVDDEEREMFKEELGIKESGLDQLVSASYDLLGLMSFLTAGETECRAWTIKKGTKAPQAAGKIHTDFEKGFIKAEVVKYDDLVECGGYTQAKEKGKVRIEGKDYVVQDGDVMLFRFNV